MNRFNKVLVLFGCVGFIFGMCLSIGLIQFGLINFPFDSTEYHWRKVNEYIGYTADPKNFGTTPDGLIGARVPFDVEPHLAALASAGEIEHVDLVLPNVPNNGQNNLHWMKFCDIHKDVIIDSTGNIKYSEYPIEGELPMRLSIWFRKGGSPLIKQLIEELQDKSQEK